MTSDIADIASVHGIKFNTAGVSTMKAKILEDSEEHTFEALQFHLHFPSEHTDADGNTYAGELHIVH